MRDTGRCGRSRRRAARRRVTKDHRLGHEAGHLDRDRASHEFAAGHRMPRLDLLEVGATCGDPRSSQWVRPCRVCCSRVDDSVKRRLPQALSAVGAERSQRFRALRLDFVQFQIAITPRTTKGRRHAWSVVEPQRGSRRPGPLRTLGPDQLIEGKLRAQVIAANERRSYRVQRSDLDTYLARHRTLTVEDEEGQGRGPTRVAARAV